MSKVMVLFLATIALLLPVWSIGNASVVDIDAAVNGSPVWGYTPVSLFLNAGTYDVTPIVGTYTAWNAWPWVSLPSYGWLNSYSYSFDSSDWDPRYTAGDGQKYATAIDAYNNHVDASITLGSNGFVYFWVPDSDVSDNSGGISLSIALHTTNGGGNGAVPEPATLLLLGAGLIGIASYGRKKLN